MKRSRAAAAPIVCATAYTFALDPTGFAPGNNSRLLRPANFPQNDATSLFASQGMDGVTPVPGKKQMAKPALLLSSLLSLSLLQKQRR